MSPSSPLPGREGLGVGAAEALGGAIQYRHNDAVGILYQVVVPDSHDRPAVLLKEGIAANITSGFGMLAAVEFDNQLGLPASEVCGKWTHWQLAREFGSITRQESPK